MNTDDAVSYLKRAGVIPSDPPATVRELGGGVSNVVEQVEYEGGCVVVKRPLANLDVEDDWPADLTRVHNETEAARTYATVLERVSLDSVSVPSVFYESETDHVAVFEAAPTVTTWKEELLAERVDERVTALLARCLAAVHDQTTGDDDVRAAFENYRPFEQLRIDPYHRTVAKRHPDVATIISDEIERLRQSRQALIHGDYSPKNVLVDRSGNDLSVWIIDFEVAHWGDPAFDVAFLCNHLCIKSIHCATTEPYIRAARRFWQRYDRDVRWDQEASTVREFGILMLARVDGKSPVEYVDGETKDLLREAAKTILHEEYAKMDDVFELITEVARDD